MSKSKFSVRQITVTGFFSALAYVLMLIHLPFKYLGFLEFEFSDVPAIIAAMAYGPVYGVIIELIKNLIKALTATTTGCVGELANFIINACYIIPLGIVYKKSQHKHKALLAFIAANIAYVIAGIIVNYYITVPLYAGGDMQSIINLTSKTVPAISSLKDVVLIGITPFNVVKGIIVSIVGYYCYKFLRKIIIDL